jgi:hypothetical protein
MLNVLLLGLSSCCMDSRTRGTVQLADRIVANVLSLWRSSESKMFHTPGQEIKKRLLLLPRPPQLNLSVAFSYRRKPFHISRRTGFAAVKLVNCRLRFIHSLLC